MYLIWQALYYVTFAVNDFAHEEGTSLLIKRRQKSVTTISVTTLINFFLAGPAFFYFTPALTR